MVPEHPVADEAFDRIFEFVDENAHRRVVLAQHQHHFLGFGNLGKSGKTAQVTEQHGHSATMALEHALIMRGGHELRDLRR